MSLYLKSLEEMFILPLLKNQILKMAKLLRQMEKPHIL